MIPRYRQNVCDSEMLADQAGRWVKVDDVAFGLSISADEERLLRLIRTGDFLNSSSLYGQMVQRVRQLDQEAANA